MITEVKKYTIGKGRLAFKPDYAGAEGVSYLRLGNAPAFNLTLTIEKLEHFSSEGGLQIKDASVITKTTLMGAFTLDEPSIDNLKMFLMSKNKASYNQTAQAAFTDVTGENATSAGTVEVSSLGVYIPLYHSTDGTAVISNPVANPYNDGGTTLTLGASSNDPGSLPTATAYTQYEIRVLTAGSDPTAATFAWRANGGAWTSPVNASLTEIELGTTNVFVVFSEIYTLAVNDSWTIDVNIPNTANTRLFNITTGASTFTLKSSDDNITYVEGEEGNYQLDRKAGILYINKDQTGSLVTNAIVPGTESNPLVLNTQAKWDANTTAAHVDAFTLTTLKGHLLFVGDPPVGEATDVQGYVSLTPTGDLAMVGDGWAQMQFQAEYLSHANYLDSESLQGMARVTYRSTI